MVRDLMPSGSRIGGTAAFAAAQAHRLGVDTAIVTRIGSDMNLKADLAGIAIAGRPADTSTEFENTYDGSHRRQRVPRQAPAIEAEDVPESWRETPIALIAPVCGEVDAGVATLFSDSFTGMTAQGWLRRLDGQRMVQRQAWDGVPFWTNCSVLFVSDEDLVSEVTQLSDWTRDVGIVVETKERRGARVHEDGRWREIGAYPSDEVDATGAGDIFAAAFLIRYHETNDSAAAARFAAAAAACSVEGRGIRHVAGRDEIDERMARHPEVALR